MEEKAFVGSTLGGDIMDASVSLVLTSNVTTFTTRTTSSMGLGTAGAGITFSSFAPARCDAGKGPGVVMLAVSSLNCKRLPFSGKSFSPGAVRGHRIISACGVKVSGTVRTTRGSAPALLSLVSRNMQFAGNCITRNISNPSHTTVVANQTPTHFNICSGASTRSNVPLARAFLPRLFRGRNCCATTMNG